MSHIGHLRIQFKSMNIFDRCYDYICMYYEICPIVQEEIFHKFRQCTFAIWLLSPDVKRRGLSTSTNLNPLLQEIFAKFGGNWRSGSVKEDFKFSLVCKYFPWKIAWPFIK